MIGLLTAVLMFVLTATGSSKSNHVKIDKNNSKKVRFLGMKL